MVMYILIKFCLKSNHFGSTVKTGKLPFYASLSAVMIFSRDARKAGKTPPAKPMISENDRDLITMPGVRAKLKASSEKV